MPRENNKITYFVVRIGGWDGIALQAELWLDVLNSMKKRVRLVTGEIETEQGPLDNPPFSDAEIETIPELNIENQKILYNMSFKRRYDREKWVDRFVREKELLKRQFFRHIMSSNTVMLHNFSIKHLIPSAWAAMYELMLEHPEKRFISIAADSPFERSYIMEKFSKEVLVILKDARIWYKKTPRQIKNRLAKNGNNRYIALPGPDRAPNLKYIVLNTNQKKTFHNIYGIPDEDLMVIHDIGNFDDEKVRRKPGKNDFEKFFKYLERNQLTSRQDELNKNDIFLISPVRPIRRKKLIEVAYAARLFQEYTNRKRRTGRVVLVVTHPNRDEKPYFTELKRFTKKFGITFIFLGNEIKLRKDEENKIYTYDEVMNHFSYLNSACIIGSEFGGWENGILEATEHKMPVSVNPLLPSFQDMVALGYNYIPAPIMIFSDLIHASLDTDNLKFPSIKTFYDKMYSRIFVKKTRRANVNHNYSIGLRAQSKKAARPMFKKLLRSFDEQEKAKNK
ncbi:MAG: hypothetical protein ACLFSL_01880 [Candidatus Woesearchaeota archaeon]